MNHGLTMKAVKINRQTFKYLKQPNRAFNASLELFLFLDFMRHKDGYNVFRRERRVIYVKNKMNY